MAKTVVELGTVVQNRGQYASNVKYYKDNIVQYQNSSYIVTSVPQAIGYLQNVVPTTPNSGWSIFAYGAADVIAKTPRVDVSQSFTDAEKKQVRANIGLGNGDVDAEPTAGSDNLVKSGGAWSDLAKLNSENEVFFPVIVQNITRDIIKTIGRVITNEGNTVSAPSAGYSDPIQVSSGDRIIVSGCISATPFFVNCTQDGTFISATRGASSVNDVYSYTFSQDGYIQLNGRIKVDGFGLIHGCIFHSAYTIPEITQKIGIINQGVYKYISNRGMTFVKTNSGVLVVIGTLFVYNILSSSVSSIQDTTEYTLNDSNRFLVLTKEGSITTRAASVYLLDSDAVLLYYDDNASNKDIVGGALYNMYLNAKLQDAVTRADKLDRNTSVINSKVEALYYRNDEEFVLDLQSKLTDNGYISSNGTVERTSGVYKHSSVIQVFSGQKFYCSGGVGTDIPYFVFCDSEGTFVTASRNSTGITSQYKYVFEEDSYIKVNGNPYVYKGCIYVGNDWKESLGWVNIEPSKKIIYAPTSSYSKTSSSVTITLDTVIYYDNKLSQFITVYADGDSSSHHPKSFTLSGSNMARILVITQSGTITTRGNNAGVLPTDIVLYIYNTTIFEIVGGHLFPDYLNKIKNEGSDVSDIPQNLGQVNCIRKAYQMASVKWTPKNGNIPYNTGNFPTNTQQTGMIYSSAKEYNQFVFEDVSLETYMTAVNNPRSVLYTENISASDSQSSIGRTYHGVNCAAYYGSVCSGLLTFSYGLPANVTTYEFRDWDKMEEIADQTPYGLQIGDAVWQSGHIQLVTGITRNKYGVITNIEIVENAAATTKIKNYTVESLQSYINTYDCVLLRYKDLYMNREYTPLTDFVAVEDETQGSYTYNNDICPNYGNKACYNEGDDVVLNLRDDYSSYGFTTLEVYKGDALTPIISRSISGIDETLTGLSYGDYKARITGSNSLESDYVQFKVVNAEVVKSGDSFTFSSENSTPIYYEFCDIEGRRSYAITGISTHTFTSSEISNGEATPTSPIISSGNYHYLKVHFATEYGRVIKVIDWEA